MKEKNNCVPAFRVNPHLESMERKDLAISPIRQALLLAFWYNLFADKTISEEARLWISRLKLVVRSVEKRFTLSSDNQAGVRRISALRAAAPLNSRMSIRLYRALRPLRRALAGRSISSFSFENFFNRESARAFSSLRSCLSFLRLFFDSSETTMLITTVFSGMVPPIKIKGMERTQAIMDRMRSGRLFSCSMPSFKFLWLRVVFDFYPIHDEKLSSFFEGELINKCVPYTRQSSVIWCG